MEVTVPTSNGDQTQKPAEKTEDLIRMRKVSHFLLSHNYAAISPC